MNETWVCWLWWSVFVADAPGPQHHWRAARHRVPTGGSAETAGPVGAVVAGGHPLSTRTALPSEHRGEEKMRERGIYQEVCLTMIIITWVNTPSLSLLGLPFDVGIERCCQNSSSHRQINSMLSYVFMKYKPCHTLGKKWFILTVP